MSTLNSVIINAMRMGDGWCEKELLSLIEHCGDARSRMGGLNCQA